MRLLSEKIKSIYMKYERFASPAALFVGFVFDNFTLTRIDQLYDNIVLFSYLIIAGVGITLVQLYENSVFKGLLVKKAAPFLPLLIQFAFGGLFSGYFIFYSRSASLASSWFFILLLLGLLVGNEFFRKHYRGLVFQVSIFYFALFSFAIFFVPVIAGKMGVWIFLLSGLISLVVIATLLFVFAYIAPESFQKKGKLLKLSISSIFVLINVLYFTNIIPPIPLSLKDAGVYHFVGRTESGNYIVRSEVKKWYEFDIGSKKFHHARGGSAYVYSAVFAPTDLNTNILHRWQYYDDKKQKWIITNEIAFPIFGGRGGGYRGYSFKEKVTEGRWRVDVVTNRGQLLGRISFEVIFTEDIPEIQTVIQN